jgi:L-asparagine transporter-like permease
MSSAPDASNTADARQGLGAMTVRGAVFLGVGSMVGAGIFALLGEAGAVAGAAVWLSFLIAGIVATLQGYATAKLGARYPSSGGIVTFLIQGFREGASHCHHVLAAVFRGTDRHRHGVGVIRQLAESGLFRRCSASSPGSAEHVA